MNLNDAQKPQRGDAIFEVGKEGQIERWKVWGIFTKPFSISITQGRNLNHQRMIFECDLHRFDMEGITS